jgi:hypothetical protein
MQQLLPDCTFPGHTVHVHHEYVIDRSTATTVHTGEPAQAKMLPGAAEPKLQTSFPYFLVCVWQCCGVTTCRQDSSSMMLQL